MEMVDRGTFFVRCMNSGNELGVSSSLRFWFAFGRVERVEATSSRVDSSWVANKLLSPQGVNTNTLRRCYEACKETADMTRRPVFIVA